MKRPHSAKPAKHYWAQTSIDENPKTEEQFKHFINAKKQMSSGISVSNNDLSRLLPKRIQQDKQRLYCQTLQLKNNLNEITEENMRLKTKVAILEREKDKLNRTDESGLRKGGKNINAVGLGDKQNGIVNNLKKIVRQSREQTQNYKNQLIKLKRTIRYTKLNQLQIQKQTFLQQNKKQSKKMHHLHVQLQSRVRQDDQIQQLQKDLKAARHQLKEMNSDNIKYEELLQETEMKYKEVAEKLLLLQKKWQRDLAVQRRKVDQLTKQTIFLKGQIKILNQKLQEKKKNQTKLVRPVSSHPYKNQNTGRNVESKDNLQKKQALQKNQKLKKQIEQAKQKLKDSEVKLKIVEPSSNLGKSKDQSIQFVLTKQTKNDQVKIKQQDQYLQDFQISKEPQSKSKSQSKTNKKDLSDRRDQSATMKQIREVLSYRMKYNRYPFDELTSDIKASSMSQFNYADLLKMLIGQPFYLTNHYAHEFLKVCFKKNKIGDSQQISSDILIFNLRKVIDQFQLFDQQEEQRMLYKLAQVLTKYRQKLQKQFLQLNRKGNLINKEQAIKVLKGLNDLSQAQIDLAICYIAVTSQNLNSINYIELLDKFYINNSRSLQHNIESKNSDGARQQLIKQDDELSMGENQHLDFEEPLSDNDMI